MATVSYTDWSESRNKKSTASKKDFKVGYFKSLKDDGDEVIVRFAYESVKEFNLQTVHKVKVGDKFRTVACLGDGCPLCASGDKVRTKFYVKIVEYIKDENGKVFPKSVIWERPANFSKKIISAYTQAVEMGVYPTTSTIGDVVFKIKRNGAKGSMDTDYDVIPANPNIFKADVYVKNFEDFADLDLAHHSYMVRTAEEVSTFVETGDFPVIEKTEVTPTTSVVETPKVTPTTAPSPRRYTL